MSIQNGGLGARPMGFGRPNTGQSEGSSIRTSYLSRLMNTIATNQRAAQGSDNFDPGGGFQGYSYNKGRGKGVFGGMFSSEEGAMTDEEYRLDVIEQAAFKGSELYTMLYNRQGRFYGAVKAALDYLPKPEPTMPRDNVVGEFIDEVINNLSLYRYCCSYACILFSATIADYALADRTEELVRNERLQHDAVFNNFINILGMQFLSWLEFHPESISLLGRLSPQIRSRIEKFENSIDGIHGMILSVSVGNLQVPFPWKKGAINRIMEKSHAGAPVYELHSMYEHVSPTGITGNTLWGTHEISAGQVSPTGGLPSWFHEFAERQENASYNVDKPVRTQPYAFENQSVNLMGDWDNVESPEKKKARLIELAKKVTVENRTDFDFNIWFKRIPDTDKYIIDPDYFKHLSTVIDYDGTDLPYRRSGWVWNGYVPIVELDWGRGLYNYENLYVGEENVELVLTNPEKVIPKLNAENTEVITASFDEYFAEVAELSDLFPSSKTNEAHIECKTLDKAPTVLYGNVPIEIDTNEEVVKSVKDVSLMVKARTKEPPDVLVLPMISRKAICINDVKFHYRTIEEKLPFLITGYDINMQAPEFFNLVKRRLQLIGSKELTDLVSEHLTNVVNRWLIECRFYDDDPESKNYLAVDNILEDYNEFLAKARKYDPATGEALRELNHDLFLKENIPIFSDKETQSKYIAKSINNIEDGVLSDARKITLEKSVLLEKQYALAHISAMAPIEQVGRVFIEGSQLPQMRWLVDKIPDYLMKHFNRKVPLVISFADDSSPKIWAVTRSNFCESKFTLRRISFYNPLPLFSIMS